MLCVCVCAACGVCVCVCAVCVCVCDVRVCVRGGACEWCPAADESPRATADVSSRGTHEVRLVDR